MVTEPEAMRQALCLLHAGRIVADEADPFGLLRDYEVSQLMELHDEMLADQAAGLDPEELA